MDLDYYMQGNEREYRKLVAQYQNETEGGWCSLRMTCTHVYSVAYLILNSVYCNPHGSIPRLLKNSKPFEDGQLSLCNGLLYHFKPLRLAFNLPQQEFNYVQNSI